MMSDGSYPTRSHADVSSRRGFPETHLENMLRDSVLLAAALTDRPTALILRDATGTTFRDGIGLSPEQLADLELGPAQATQDHPREAHGLLVIESMPLLDDCTCVIGVLCILSREPHTLPVPQRDGLKVLVQHIQTIIDMDHQKFEARDIPRAPSAASFVPGLVHELGSFIFGISASLDALEARFTDLHEVDKYSANIRKSLDRMGEFIQELREYGYPQRLSWTVLNFETMLRKALDSCLPLAEKKGIRLRLEVEGPLPAIQADESGLQAVFTRLATIVLQQEEPGGLVVLHTAASRLNQREVIFGHLEFSSTRMKEVDPARLFEPFYFRVSGLGRLTLPGARRLIESHGGTLTAGPGPKGNMRISFTLPSESAHPQPEASRP